jgi:GAF domain-containing protein
MADDFAAEDAASQPDDAGLSAGLGGLAGLVVGGSTLEQMLTEVAEFALQAVPGADGVGVTMLEAGRPDTIVSSARFVRDVDAIQYRLGEGPCISAATQGRTTGSSALGEDASWPRFGPHAAALGIHSAISLPLLLDGETIGALNVYAYARSAFDAEAQRVGELFAAPAAVAIHNARVLDQVQREAIRLQTALANRSAIDHAIGIIMSRTGISEEEAFVQLRIMSQDEHVKLSVVAVRLVEQAVSRARTRRAESTPTIE